MYEYNACKIQEIANDLTQYCTFSAAIFIIFDIKSKYTNKHNFTSLKLTFKELNVYINIMRYTRDSQAANEKINIKFKN